VARWLGVDDSRKTPAYVFEDGKDYVPSRVHVVFAHHFSVIAGAGPIVGPVLALTYGWLPALSWIVIGCVLFGAMHDMTAMFVSMREEGRSMAELSRRTLGNAGYFLFLAFLIVILTLINAIFLNLSCKALTAAYPVALLKLAPTEHILTTFVNARGVMMGRIGGIATTSVLVITLAAPIIGWWVHKRQAPTLALYALAVVICAVSVWAGFLWPIQLDEATWRYVMAGYIFCACWLPVWLVLQPRDFINAQILYAGVVVMFLGVIALGLRGTALQTPALALAEGARVAGPIWPFLMITVACGAISGFHSLAASGTTVKQITRESDVRRVGYNAMLMEGVLALLALLLASAALPRAEYFSIVFPASNDGNPILAFAVAMGYLLHDLTGLKVAFGSVLGILVLEGFVVTTLDTAVRLCRYMMEEFWLVAFPRVPAPVMQVLRHPLFNTLLAVGLMLFFAGNSTIMSAWKIFGAGNQLIAALAMVVATVWLLQRGRSFWFALVPACIMSVTTFVTLILAIRQNVAPAGSGQLLLPGKWPLTIAALLLLTLAVGILLVSVRRIRDERDFRF